MKHKDYSGVDATDLQRQMHDIAGAVVPLSFSDGHGADSKGSPSIER